MQNNTDLDHALQLRLTKTTVADIDEVIATVPQLCGFNRCRFIRAAVLYTLASISEEADPDQNEPGGQTQNEEQAN
jgi:hypothetical protein